MDRTRSDLTARALAHRKVAPRRTRFSSPRQAVQTSTERMGPRLSSAGPQDRGSVRSELVPLGRPGGLRTAPEHAIGDQYLLTDMQQLPAFTPPGASVEVLSLAGGARRMPLAGGARLECER